MSLTERGQRDTLYDIRKLLAFADAVDMPRAALLPLNLGQPDAILESDHTVTLQGLGTVDMDRREFTTLAAGLAASAVLAAPARADRAHVRYLQSALTRLRTQDRTVGGGALLSRALRYFAYARRILDESDHTAAIGQELLVVTADLGTQTAWFAYDANNQPLARRVNREAALLADSAGAGEHRVHVYAQMAQQATYLAQVTGRQGFAREALRFINRAADATRHAPSPALHALISLRQALAHAQLGDEVAFRSTIATSRRELDRGPTRLTRRGRSSSAIRRSPATRRRREHGLAVLTRRHSFTTRFSTTLPGLRAIRHATGHCWPGRLCRLATTTRRSATA